MKLRFLVFLAVVAVLGCSDHRQFTTATSPPSLPCILVYEWSGYVMSEEPRTGVLLAIWPDGKIIRAASEEQCGRSYVAGTLTAAQLQQVAEIINRSRPLYSKQAKLLVVDAASEELPVRLGSKVKIWDQSPGFEGTGNSDSSNACMSAVVTQIMSIPINDARPEPPAKWKEYPEQWEL